MKLVFQGQKKGDYHAEMNSETFIEWFVRLCQALSGPSTIVMDNASYHNKRTQDSIAPTSATRKDDMIQWLSAKNVMFDSTVTKPELYEIIKQHKPKPIYCTDVIANQWGHDVLRTPVRQCELNPIELVWAKVKTCVASKNSTFKLKDVKKLVNESLDGVLPEEWQKCVEHVKTIEDEYRRTMHIMEDIDPVIINLDDSFSDNEDPVEEPVEYVEIESEEESETV